MIKCPYCKYHEKIKEKMIRERKALFLLHLTCPICGGRGKVKLKKYIRGILKKWLENLLY